MFCEEEHENEKKLKNKFAGRGREEQKCSQKQQSHIQNGISCKPFHVWQTTKIDMSRVRSQTVSVNRTEKIKERERERNPLSWTH